MPLWGNNDLAAQSAIFAAGGLNKAPNTANRTALFANTTSGAFVTGQTVSQRGISAAEQVAARANTALPRAAHTGWVLRRVGSGGRAGRTQQEVLVAMAGNLTGNAS
jgi:hypothetical protein